jgi:hypothetical protein
MLVRKCGVLTCASALRDLAGRFSLLLETGRMEHLGRFKEIRKSKSKSKPANLFMLFVKTYPEMIDLKIV